MKRVLSIVAISMMLAGCGGGGGQSGAPSVPAASQAKTANGSVVLSIPVGSSTTQTQSLGHAVRYPQFVSPNASSVTLSVNGGPTQVFDVSATSSLCTTVSGARNCTLTFGAPVGSDTFAFVIYSGPNATGNNLAQATTTQAVTATAPFSFTVAMNAAVGTIVASLMGTSGGGTCPNQTGGTNISEGCPGSGVLTVAVDDPSGAQVTGSAPYAAPIQITASDPTVTVSPAQITAPGQTATASYNGGTMAATTTNTITFTLSAGGQLAQVTIPAVRSYLYVANSNAPPGTTPPGGGNIVVYPFGATGNATPVRTIAGANTGVTNPDNMLLDASDNLYVLDNGPYTSNSNPLIDVFAPGATGNVAPTRQISGLAAVTFNAPCESMIFDPTGHYLYVLCDDGGGTLHVFSSTWTGTVMASVAQLATIICDSFSHPITMAFDATGDLYVADPGTHAILYFPAPIPLTGSYVLIAPTTSMTGGGTAWPATVDPIGVAIDQQGTLYSTISYFNSTSGGPDASNQVGIWKTTTIPCNGNACNPSASLIGGTSFVHAPSGLTLDPAGNLYMSNQFANTVTVFARSTITSATNPTTNPTVLHTINTGTSPNAPVGMIVGP
jgi:hypothetical protein